MGDQRHILKKGLEKPSLDFTKNLMREIKAEEKSLSRVLQEHGHMTTSSCFSANLMQELEGMSPQQTYEPVISKRIWIGISVILVVFLAFVFTTSELDSSGGNLPININQIDFNFIREFESNPILIYAICGVLLFSISLLAEQRLSHKKGKSVH